MPKTNSEFLVSLWSFERLNRTIIAAIFALSYLGGDRYGKATALECGGVHEI